MKYNILSLESFRVIGIDFGRLFLRSNLNIFSDMQSLIDIILLMIDKAKERFTIHDAPT
jgi:hypothetical protein